MICYRDMTFCSYFEKCSDGKGCHRALHEDVKESANKFGLPICQFSEKPECFRLEEETKCL